MRSSTGRTVLWALAAVVVLAAAAAAYERGTDGGDGDGDGDADTGEVATSEPGPQLPEDVGDGCGSAALTDAADLDASRTVARCAAGFPEPQPLAETARLRVAVTQWGEAAAPVLLADRLAEFDAEALEVEIVELPADEAFAALASGDVDAVAGPVDAPFFDAAHGGTGVRWVLGGTLSTAPGDTHVPQAGLWYRSDLLGGPGRWSDLRGMALGLGAGWRSAGIYPVGTVAAEDGLSLNDVDLVAATGEDAVDRLLDGELAAAWVDPPAWSRAADADGIALAATLPADGPIDGTMMSARLLDADRDVGLAYTRAVIRTINTHLTGDYREDEDVMDALAEATGADADELAATPALLFDWEIRAGTTERLQDAMIEIGSVGYERPLAQDELVDRTLALDAVGLRAR